MLDEVEGKRVAIDGRDDFAFADAGIGHGAGGHVAVDAGSAALAHRRHVRAVLRHPLEIFTLVVAILATVAVAALIVVASVLGYHTIMRLQSILTWITGAITCST